MIRPLRRAHRWLFVVIAVLLPFVLVIALGFRAAPPVQPDWPFEVIP